MTDPALEPERRPTRSEMFAEMVWIAGPLGAVWVGATLVAKLFPDWNPLLQLGAVVIPIAAVLYGIALWRRRHHA